METRPSAEQIIAAVCALENCPSDKKEIAKMLNIGSTTVGRVLAFLSDIAVIGETVNPETPPGKQANVFDLQNNPVFAVVRISPCLVRTDFYGFGLDVVISEETPIDDPLFIDDFFTSYFLNLSLSEFSLCGIAVVCSGTAKDGCFMGSGIVGFDGLPIAEMIKEQFGDTVFLLDNISLWEFPVYEGITVIVREDDGHFRSAVMLNGELISGKKGAAGHIGRLKSRSGMRISSTFPFSECTAEYMDNMADIVKNAILLLDPDRIIISSERYPSECDIISHLRESLMIDHGFRFADIPELILSSDVSDRALSRLRRHLRDLYLTKISQKSI